MAPTGERVLPLTADLVRCHQQSVWRYLRVLGCPAAEADDLAQETFLALMRGKVRDEGPKALRAWLRTTARYLYFAHCRSLQRSPIVLDDLEAAWQDYERDDDGEAFRAALRACLDTLPKQQRALLDLQVREHAGLERIAAACELTAEGAKSLLRRIKERLRECVTRRLGHGSH
jgi:RNA polymerase sigma-70 factor (ECF subfamily)